MSEAKCTITKKNDVWLILDKEKDYKPIRKIGKINPQKRTFKTEKYPKHVMRCNNALGIAHVVLKKLKESNEIDFVEIKYHDKLKDRILKTTIDYYLSNCEFMKFERNSLELQCFLPIDLFGLRIAKKWEKTQSERTNVSEINKNPPTNQSDLSQRDQGGLF
jgi:hypothetical protein